MLPIRKKFVFLAISLFCFCASVVGSDAATINAVSASCSDVSAAVSAASSGDTVVVPAGEATWSQPLDITKDIQLIGAGADVTIITSSYEAPSTFATDSRIALIYYHPSNPGNTNMFRISGFTFDVDFKCGAIFMKNHSVTAAQKTRIDHNIFKNALDYRMITSWGQVWGVIDNNTFDNTKAAITPYGSNDISWENFTYSFGTADNLYFEDNIFLNLKGQPHAGGAGGRYACRYNTYTTVNRESGPFYLTVCDVHGNQAEGRSNHSAMGTEVYGNKVIKGEDGWNGNLINLRGGKGIAFYNTVIDYPVSKLRIYEECTDTYHPPATGPDGQPQHVSDSYFWNNRQDYSGDLMPVFIIGDYYDKYLGIENDPPILVENTTFWQQRSTGVFDGSGDVDKGGGIGCGTLANRPATCTVGVAYWATDQSCSDLTGMVGANSSTPISGTLYRCTAPNTWTAYFTPYTYPHPLRKPAAPNPRITN